MQEDGPTLPTGVSGLGGMRKAGDLLNPLEGGFRDCRTYLLRRKLFGGELVFFPASVSHAAHSFALH